MTAKLAPSLALALLAGLSHGEEPIVIEDRLELFDDYLLETVEGDIAPPPTRQAGAGGAVGQKRNFLTIT